MPYLYPVYFRLIAAFIKLFKLCVKSKFHNWKKIKLNINYTLKYINNNIKLLRRMSIELRCKILWIPFSNFNSSQGNLSMMMESGFYVAIKSQKFSEFYYIFL